MVLRLTDREVEFDPHCRRVLKARMKEGNLPDVPIQEKVQEYKPSKRSIISECEAVAAGFSCQAKPDNTKQSMQVNASVFDSARF